LEFVCVVAQVCTVTFQLAALSLELARSTGKFSFAIDITTLLKLKLF
jgi:hypothetical protein